MLLLLLLLVILSFLLFMLMLLMALLLVRLMVVLLVVLLLLLTPPLLMLLLMLLLLPLFVLIIADVGAVPAGAAAAPASDGASVVVAVWLERGSFSLGVPQWRGVKGALGMQWPNLGSVTMGQNIGNSSGTPASSGRVIASTASRVLLKRSAAVAAQLSLKGS